MEAVLRRFGAAMSSAVSGVANDSALVKMVKYASERMNASYLDWWRRPGFLDMVLPSRLRHVLDEGGGYIGGGGKDDHNTSIARQASSKLHLWNGNFYYI